MPEGPPYEHQVTPPGGEVPWQEWFDRPHFDADGRLVEFASVGRERPERPQVAAVPEE